MVFIGKESWTWGAKNRCNKAEGKVLERLTLTISAKKKKKVVSPALK